MEFILIITKKTFHSPFSHDAGRWRTVTINPKTLLNASIKAAIDKAAMARSR
jgi:hypothetical protein